MTNGYQAKNGLSMPPQMARLQREDVKLSQIDSVP
jgi:hypothetical protein